MTALRRGDPSPDAIELILSLAHAWTVAEIAAASKASESVVADILDRFAGACAACGGVVMPFARQKLSGIAHRMRCINCGRER